MKLFLRRLQMNGSRDELTLCLAVKVKELPTVRGPISGSAEESIAVG